MCQGTERTTSRLSAVKYNLFVFFVLWTIARVRFIVEDVVFPLSYVNSEEVIM